MAFLYNDPGFKKLRRLLRRNSTETEQILWQYLRQFRFEGFIFQRQYSVGRYVLDFYCPKVRLAVEVDGGQHYTTAGKKYDDERTGYLENVNICVIRFTNDDVRENIDGVVDVILSYVSPRGHTSSSPPIGRRG